MKGLPALYAVVMKAAVQTQFQYRTANYAYMLPASPLLVMFAVMSLSDLAQSARKARRYPAPPA